MKEKKIIDLWRSGLSKNKIAEIYRREYNMQIKIIRSSVRHRHSGKFISNYEALRIVERVLYKYVTKSQK